MADRTVMQSGRYKAYPEYKDSGVEWLGKIPSDWDLLCGKWKFKSLKEVNRNLQCMDRLALTMRGVIERSIDSDDGLQPSAFTGYQIFEKNDLVFKLIDLENYKTSRVGLVFKKGIMSPAYIRLKPNKDVSSKFFYYFYFDLYLRGIYNQIGGQGVRSALNASDLLEIQICVPSKDEQVEIANFLDHEIEKISTLIEKQQRLIELLTEKRQAVISHAVTKGLNPDVPMKDSGVEWLGEVPEHWEASKLKYYSGIQGGYAFSSQSFSEQGVQVLKIANVYQNRLALERQPTYVSENMVDLLPEFVVQSDDILMSLTGTLGKRDYGFAVKVESEGKYLLNQRVAKLNPIDSKVNRDFLVYTLWSESYLNQLYSLPSGTKQANLSNSDVLDIWIAIPPNKAEQEEIANTLAKEKDTFDQLVLKAKQQIQLMQERRTALISAAVTGKIDVRHWVKPE